MTCYHFFPCITELTLSGRVMPNGDRELGQPWLGYWLVVWSSPSHCLNQSWLNTSEVLLHSSDSNFTGNAKYIYLWCDFENGYSSSNREQWVNSSWPGVAYICVLKNSSHFPGDAYMRHKSLYFSYGPRGRPTKQCQAKMSLYWLPWLVTIFFYVPQS